MTSRASVSPARQDTIRTSELVASRLKEIRKRRGLTAQQLADRCAALGATGISTNVIANIETRRRDLSVDELLVFALALDVAPVHLLAPVPDQPVTLAVTPQVKVSDTETLWRWLRGEAALSESHARLYYGYALEFMPPPEGDRALSQYAHAVLQEGAKRLVSQYEAEATQFLANVRGQVNDLLGDLEHAIRDGVEGEELLEVLGSLKGRLSRSGGKAAGKKATKPAKEL